MFAKIRPRRGTKTQWETANTVLAEGEIAIEVPDDGVGTGTVNIKIGDGTTEWNNLPYASEEVALKALIGNTDISEIGDGTATGAISAINSNLEALKKAKVLSSPDVLKINENGEFYVMNATNTPSDVANSGYLEIVCQGSTYQKLTYSPHDNTRVYVNVCSGGTWTGWSRKAEHTGLPKVARGKTATITTGTGTNKGFASISHNYGANAVFVVYGYDTNAVWHIDLFGVTDTAFRVGAKKAEGEWADNVTMTITYDVIYV